MDIESPFFFCPEDAINGMRRFNANMIVWQESQAGGMPALGGFQTGTSCRDHRPCPETVNELTFDAAKFRMAVGFPLIRNACLLG